MNDCATTADTIISSETLIALFRRAGMFMARAHHHRGHARHAQAHVLSILGERGPMNQRELLEMLNVRSASLSELLAKLERGGFILREKDPQDRRNFIISATSQGTEEAADNEKERRESADAIFSALSQDEQQQLGQLLIKLIIALEEDESLREACRDRQGHGHERGCRGRHCGWDHHPHHRGRRGPDHE